jgi:uncharacterized protein YjiS (DUF1127 family)
MANGYELSLTHADAQNAVSRTRLALRLMARRVRALARLFARQWRARRRFDDLRHLDERTLRDLGVTRSELASVVAELGGRASATRRRTDHQFWVSASSRFPIRAVDSSL